MGPSPVPKYNNATNVKELLDMIGKDIQKEARNDALEHSNSELHGLLTNVTYPGDEHPKGSTPEDPCGLDHEYHTNVTDGYNYPCKNRPRVRFSDIYGGQCTDSKIKGNECNNGGACAPFRRLFLCDQNLEHIKEGKIESTHNLLLEVLLAAKHEGESIIKDYEHLGHHNSEGICIALARSFADIGDIVRGKDLYLGNSKEKEKLEKNLRQIFKKIYDKLTHDAQTHYKKDDKGSGNYFQLREDWWALNRLEVWKAITCKAPQNANYFRNACSEGTTSTQGRCRCVTDVPTYFDYVPQFLRWFEEWAEEFCRKKKIYVGIVKKFCRGEYDGKKRYCSHNGYDCEDTIRAIGTLRMGKGCTKCLVACSHYKNWLANQEEEFKKQKTKYEKEITGSNPQKKCTSHIVNNEYDRKFYDELKIQYRKVDTFLELLNQEKVCKAITKEEGTIDFTINDSSPTFSRSDYCQVCPECGVKCDGNNCTQRTKNDPQCSNKLIYKPQFVELTDINVLCSGDENHDITEKLSQFCRKAKGTNYPEDEEWKCYYEKSDNNMCKMTNNKKATEKLQNSHTHPDIMTYIDFFMFWVNHMLKDSIDWRETINNCVNNAKSNKCKSGCKRKCDCFKKWVEKKQDEWKHIKKQFEKQPDLVDEHHFGILEVFLEQEFLPYIEDAYGNDEAIEKIEELLEERRTHADSELNDEEKKDIIDFLLEHELEDASTCVKSNENKEDITDDDYLDEIHILKRNPCGRSSGGRHDVNVTHIAREMQREAKNQLDKSGSRGSSVLKADASKGTYRKGGKADELNNICNIKEDHSSCTNRSKKPCDGKDTEQKMFDINEGWKHGPSVNKTHTDTYMPPRRQHFCTSNLEHLQTKESPLCGNNSTFKVINDSFLGDVLLSAKSEAKFIIDKYKGTNDYKDDATICRAVRYSFADLGDIIRGRDLWYEDGGAQDMEKRLIDIFQKIKQEFSDEHIQNKYTDNDKYLELRKDWWEANRYQVWNAMKCSLKDVNTSEGDCKYNTRGVPFDDYVPQRLRWMTEWAEWYCKYQAEAYKTLQKGCEECMSEKCKNGDENCTKCEEACEEYRKNIKPWKKQWDKIKEKYKTLYDKAKNDDTSSTEGSKDEKNVVEFLRKLQQANKDNNTIYSTAAGYVHQELPYMDCQKQTQFCNKNSDGSDKEYALRNEPHDHDDACACKSRNLEGPVLQEPCDIVQTLLQQSPNSNGGIDKCNPKKGELKWECDPSMFKDNNDGTCMPPRRQNLCVHYLTQLSNDAKDKELREAFIKCAAAETFLLRQYYNSKNVEDDKILHRDMIPPEFFRSMFYTFGDYRDICLGTDISKKEKDVGTAKTKIDNIFKNGKLDGLSRDQWWKEYGLSIWQGMLCALSYNTETKKMDEGVRTYLMKYIYKNNDIKEYLEEFASRPPFFRWFIEWSDEFCAQQKKKYNELKEKCNKCCNNGNVTSNECKNNCDECKQKCQDYSMFITEWQNNWNKQSQEYQKLYEKISDTKNNNITEQEQAVIDHLKNLTNEPNSSDKYSTAGKYIKQEGYIDDCNVSEQNNFDENSSGGNSDNYAFRNYPHKHQNQCECKEEEVAPPKVPEVPKKPVPEKKEIPPKPRKPKPPKPDLPPALKNAMLSSTIMWSVGIGFAAFTYFYLKKKTKASVGNLFQILHIPKSDYDIPTKLSPNRYIPYTSGKYRGKRYIYLEGDSGTDSGYTDHYSDITSSSESEYEELDINDIYVPGSPKYKTLIEVVLEPSGNNTPTSGKNTPSDNTPTNKFADNEWNTLKDDFISNMLQNTQNTEPNILHGNLDNNTHPTMSRDNMEEKPFIISIHDRNLYSGEEYNYNVNMSTNSMDDPKYVSNNVYSGIDLINDTLSGNQPIDIYDEVLKRKENELFGTNHVKQTSIHSVAKLTNSDPIHNQLELFHKWLDRHRNMCEQWNNKEELLDKLKEEWNKDNNSGNIHPSDSNKTLNTDVSIQIDMDNPKTTNEFTYVDSNPNQVDDTYVDSNPDNSSMDTILEDLDKPFNEPYYYDMYDDDIYYDVNDDNDISTVDSNAMDVPSKVQIEMDVNTKLVKEKYPIGDVWDI
ncbi:hypothetical protein C923_03716 [Plasmodium falciparum UGT5.1]|uniref:Erythrocyte membrane protein 1 n=1 Tax=Plasmodium falciparum UGT5.1 TaxID=1237627 RepID=W7JAC9_PLAFA|nr:hypothetical protein C923_03716 [Plasmodium falciparum UGT5.1]